MEVDSIHMEDDSIDMGDDSIDMGDDSIDMGYIVTLPAGSKLRACAKCGATHYCNKQCQVAHWPTHKDKCNAQAATNARLAAQGKDMSKINDVMVGRCRLTVSRPSKKAPASTVRRFQRLKVAFHKLIFTFKFEINLRRYIMAWFQTVPKLPERVICAAWRHRKDSPYVDVHGGINARMATVTVEPRSQWASTGRAVQLDTRVENAYGVYNQRLKL
jgi:hypothetical protein